MAISAARGDGLDLLAERVKSCMLGEIREASVTLPLRDARAIDYLESRAQVTDRTYDESHCTLRARLSRRHMDAIIAMGSRGRINGLEMHEGMAQLWPAPVQRSAPRIPLHERLHADGDSDA